MADEYYERYKHLSHQELYQMLRAGSPGQADTVADGWASIGDTTGALSAALLSDLRRLSPDWTSQGSREFHYRLEIIARYAQTLADEADAIRTGLTVMASSLRDTQRRAESPAQTADQTSADVVDGVLGAGHGRVLPVAAQAQAHERMVRLVAKLAAEYGVADHGNWPVTVPEPPIDLPASGNVPPVASGLAGAVGGATAMTGVNPAHHHHHGHGHGHGHDGAHVSSNATGHGTRGGHGSHVVQAGSGVVAAGAAWAQGARPVPLAGYSLGSDHAAVGHASISTASSGGGGGGSGGGGSSGSGSSGGSGSHAPGSSTPGGGSPGSPAAGGGATGAPMGGTGSMMPMAPMGGAPPAAIGAAPTAMGGAAIGPADRPWHTPDTLSWADVEDDAAPPVLGD